MRRLNTISFILSTTLGVACGPKHPSARGTNQTATPETRPNMETGPGSGPKDQQAKTGDDATAASTPPPSAETRVLGLFGGYLSCSRDAQAPFKDSRMESYLTQVQEDLASSGAPKAKYVLSCFGLDTNKVKFITSEKPDEVREATLTELFHAVDGVISTTPEASVHLVGHSYGGWLTMEYVHQIKTSLKVVTLTTIDPISLTQCTPPLVINSLLGDPASPACTRAPADFSKSLLEIIKQRARSWVNIYQTASSVLHSGPLAGAENIKQVYAPDTVEAHIDIASDPDVIAQVTALLTR